MHFLNYRLIKFRESNFRFNEGLLVILIFFWGHSFSQENLKLVGEINGWPSGGGSDNMTFISAECGHILTKQFTGTNDATCEFLFITDEGYSEKWGAGTSVTKNSTSRQTIYWNGGNSNFNAENNKYYTFKSSNVSTSGNGSALVFEFTKLFI